MRMINRTVCLTGRGDETAWGLDVKFKGKFLNNMISVFLGVGRGGGYLEEGWSVSSIKQRWFVSDAGEYLVGGVKRSRAGRKEGAEYQLHLHRSSSKVLPLRGSWWASCTWRSCRGAR